MEKYGIKRGVELKENKIYVKGKYYDVFSQIMTEFIIHEYIFELIEELLSINFIDIYESNDIIIKIIFKLTECDLNNVKIKLKNKIDFFTKTEKEINIDGIMVFCLSEFKYALCRAIEECLYDV